MFVTTITGRTVAGFTEAKYFSCDETTHDHSWDNELQQEPMLTEPYIAAMLALHRFRKHNIRELRSYARDMIFQRGINFSQLFKGIPMSVTSETKFARSVVLTFF